MSIIEILTHNYPDSEWILEGEDYEGLIWLSDSPKPTKLQLESEWPKIQEETAKKLKNKETAKVSAIAKLKKLGLTVDEVQVAFGLKE